MKVNQKLMLGLFGIVVTIGIAGGIVYQKLKSIKLVINRLEIDRYQEDINDGISDSFSNLTLSFLHHKNQFKDSGKDLDELRANFSDFQEQQQQYLETLNKYLIVYSSDLLDSSDFTTDLRNQIKSLSILATDLNASLSQIIIDLETQELIKLESHEAILIQKLEEFHQELIKTQDLTEERKEEEFNSIQKTLDSFDREVDNFKSLLVKLLAISICISGLISYQLFQIISKPIARLQVATQSMSEGSFDTIVMVESDDEIGHLSMTFNTMMQKLKSTYEELQDKITQLEDSEAKLTQSKKIAEEANRAKSVFLANMSHELRTPLNAIIGYSEMLEEEAEDLGEQSFISDLSKIKKAGKHLLGLINDILDISKIEAGRMELYIEEIDIQAMVVDIVNTVSPLIERNHNHVQVNCSSDIGKMKADLTKLRQNLFNLMSNASKFTENGLITVTVLRKDEWIYFQVRDTGIGMSSEQLQKIFQPFTQADGSTTRKYGGTGLGLSITQHFCRMMGGEITAKSLIGRGSTFIMRLPSEVVIPDATQDPSSLKEEALQGIGSGKRILIIDDDQSSQNYIASTLNSWGFEVHSAMNGTEGLILAKRLKPDVITLDVMMPGIDGWSVLTDLKANPDLAHIPVIMTTFINDQNLGYALGAADYLVKPIDRQQLLKTLQRLNIKAGGNILIVEDDPMSRDVLARQLIKEGYQVEEAVNGIQALESIKVMKPKLILLDLMMSEMDGFQVIDHLKEIPEWRSIPIVVLTAKDLDAYDRQRLQGFVESIYRKGSYDRQQFMAEIHRLLANIVSS